MSHTPTMDWKKYIYTFIITATIFISAILLSNFFSRQKIEEIRSIQDKISIDILSSETQFSLLEDSSCSDIGTGSLSTELGSLEEKLTYTEKERGSADPQVDTLKRYYSLLQIKDYMLMNKISEKCKKTPLSMIYFYSTDQSCPDCDKEGYVLTHLREEYPQLRVYSFDYNLDLSAVQTLVKIDKIRGPLPALFINSKAYYGFQSVENLENEIPELALLRDAKIASSTNATSTQVRK